MKRITKVDNNLCLRIRVLQPRLFKDARQTNSIILGENDAQIRLSPFLKAHNIIKPLEPFN